MEEYTTIRLCIPKEFDYKLNIRLAENKRLGIKRTKAEEIIKLAQIGFLKESLESMLDEFK